MADPQLVQNPGAVDLGRATASAGREVTPGSGGTPVLPGGFVVVMAQIDPKQE